MALDIQKHFKPPFTAHGDYILDADGNPSLDVRGWGRLNSTLGDQNAYTVQSLFGIEVAQALNNHFKKTEL